jgi:hypothetical protein
MAARLGGLAQPAGGLMPVQEQLIRQIVAKLCRAPALQFPVAKAHLGGVKCSKTVLPLSSTLPNMLKKRVLLSFGEFHSGPKRATRGVREQRDAGGFGTVDAVAGSQFEV